MIRRTWTNDAHREVATWKLCVMGAVFGVSSMGPWTRWADTPPSDDVVVRLRGDVRLAGETVNMTLGGRYCRRGQALCHIESDGSLRLVRPPYDHLEWTPG